MSVLRRPGGRWRLRVHHWAGRKPREAEGSYDVSHDITSDQGFGGSTPDSSTHQTHVFEGCEFDELVVGRAIHVEQMDATTWWMNVGGVTIHVAADREGRPTSVWVAGPGDYDAPVPGCAYRLTWGAHIVEPGQSPSGSATLIS